MKKILTVLLSLLMIINTGFVSKVYADSYVPYTEEHYLQEIDENGTHYELRDSLYYPETAHADELILAQDENINFDLYELAYSDEQDNLKKAKLVQLPYIESNGTQYINTGLLVSKDFQPGIHVEFQLTDLSTDHQTLFGATQPFSDDTDGLYFEAVKSGNELDFSFGAGRENAPFQFGKKVDSSVHELDLYPTEFDGYCLEFDGGNKVFADAQRALDTTRSITLFANNAEEVKNYGSYRIYGLDIYKGTEMVAHLVPVLTIEKMQDASRKHVEPFTHGLYDLLNGKLYVSATENDFTCDDAPAAFADPEATSPIVIKRYYNLKSAEALFFVEDEMRNPIIEEPISVDFYPRVPFKTPTLNLQGYDVKGWTLYIEETPLKEFLPGEEVPEEYHDLILSGNARFISDVESHTYYLIFDWNNGFPVEPARLYYNEVYEKDLTNIENFLKAYDFVNWTITGMDNSTHIINGVETNESTYVVTEETLSLKHLTAVDGATVVIRLNYALKDSYTSSYSVYMSYETIFGPLDTLNNGPELKGKKETKPGEIIQPYSLEELYKEAPAGFGLKFYDINLSNGNNKTDNPIDADIVEIPFIETNFDMGDYMLTLNPDGKNDVKDIQNVQYIDTGLLSQDVYSVDMNVDLGNGHMSSGINVLFSSLDNLRFSKYFDIAALKAVNSNGSTLVKQTMLGVFEELKHSGLSSCLLADSVQLVGGTTSIVQIPLLSTSAPIAANQDFFHVVAERDASNGTLSVGYGQNSRAEQSTTVTSSNIKSGIPFILFAGEFEDAFLGSNARYGETIVYGKDHEVLRDFVPSVVAKEIDAVHSSTGEAVPVGTLGMYDKANNKFYPSAKNEFTFSDDSQVTPIGHGPFEDGALNIMYSRNEYDVYFLEPLSISMDTEAYIYDRNLTDEELLVVVQNLLGTDEVYVKNGIVYKILEKDTYRFEEPILKPSTLVVDKKDYQFYGWESIEDNNYSSSITQHDGFFDPDYDSNPFAMPSNDLYFVAELSHSELLPSPKINLTPTSKIKKGPLSINVYDLNKDDKFTFSGTKPGSIIVYGWMNLEGDPIIGNGPTKSPVEIYDGSIEIDSEFVKNYGSYLTSSESSMGDPEDCGYIQLMVACVPSDIDLASIEIGGVKNLLGSYSTYMLRINLLGDVTREDWQTAGYKSFAHIPSGLWVAGKEEHLNYDPNNKEGYTINPRVFFGTTLLEEGIDYTITYSNNKNASDDKLGAKGLAVAKITCKGKYKGTLNRYFYIEPCRIEKIVKMEQVEVELSQSIFFFKEGKVQKPTVKAVYLPISDKEKIKIDSKNCIVKYQDENSQKIGMYGIYITIDSGNFRGDIKMEQAYTIAGPNYKLMSNLKVTGINDVNWTGDSFADKFLKEVVVKDGKNVLAIKDDYNISFLNANTMSPVEPREIGEYVLVISPAKKIEDLEKGEGYIGTYTKKFKIKGTDISKASFSKISSSYTYTGSTIKPVQELTYSFKVDGFGKVTVPLEESVHYYVDYKDNANIGTATITYYGNPQYGFVGTKKVTFKIVGTALSAYNKADLKNVVYNATPYEQDEGSAALYRISKANVKDYATKSNYTVSYSKNENAGTATVTYKGVNAYSGSVKKTFKINARNLNDELISIEDIVGTQAYTKNGAQPDVSITHSIVDDPTSEDAKVVGTKTLELGKDYTLSYKNNKKPGETATVIIKGKGNYTGTVEKTFEVGKADMYTTHIKNADLAFTGKPNAKAAITVLDCNGSKLTAGKDYDKNIAYEYKKDTVVIDSRTKNAMIRKAGEEVLATDIVFPGSTIQVTINAMENSNFTGTMTDTYSVQEYSISKAKVSISTQYRLSDEPVLIDKGSITISVDGKIVNPSAYEIVSYKNNDKAGTAQVTIKGIGTGMLSSFLAAAADIDPDEMSFVGLGGEKTFNFKIVDKPVNTIVFRFHPTDEFSGSMSDFKIDVNKIYNGDYIKIPVSKFVDKNKQKNTGWAAYINGELRALPIPADKLEIGPELLTELNYINNCGVYDIFPCVFEPH